MKRAKYLLLLLVGFPTKHRMYSFEYQTYYFNSLKRLLVRALVDGF